MAEFISFPLSTPQVQAAERVQSQANNSPGNQQHALTGEMERLRVQQREIVNETEEAENPVTDQEGHLGAEYEARKREEGGAEGEPQKADSSSSDEDDLQGRFINVVV